MKEIWKSIKGYENKYEVSTLGNVRNIKNKNFNCLYKRLRKDGYEDVGLYKNGKYKKFLVHRLVAKTFLENPYCKEQVNHKNGKKNDNRLSNLEWCTCSENLIHAYKNGLEKNGEFRPSAKLTWEQVGEIRKMYKSGNYSHRQLAKIFNIGKTTIGLIVTEKIWKKY